MNPTQSPAARLTQLKQDGYCIIENMADEGLLTKLLKHPSTSRLV